MINIRKKDEFSIKRTAFIASLMPINYIYNDANKYNINKVIYYKNVHKSSCDIIKKRYPNIKIVNFSENGFKRNVQLFVEIVKMKITNKHIIFFHECCWPEFDILGSIIRPNGWFSPLHNFSVSAVLVEMVDIPCPTSIIGKFLRKLYSIFFRHLFDIYDMPVVGKGRNYALSFKKYPDSIKQVMLVEPDRGDHGKDIDLQEIDKNNILILGGTEAIKNTNELIDLYRKIAHKFNKNGFCVYYKDHPTDPLNLKSNDCIVLDSKIPAELIDIKFDIVISVSSTALPKLAGKKISIMNMLHTWKDGCKHLRYSCIMSIPGSEKVVFIKSLHNLDVFIK